MLGPLYLGFFRKVLPRIGQAVAPNQDDAYHYLPRTVLEFPDGQALLDLLGSRGLVDLEMHPLTFGVATLYVGTKPAQPRHDRAFYPNESTPGLVVALTGASGSPYALALLRTLLKLGRTVHLTMSPSAIEVIAAEVGLSPSLDAFDASILGEVGPGRLIYHHFQDYSAGIASGSFLTAGMVVVPCSMSTLGSIAHGITTNLITPPPTSI